MELRYFATVRNLTHECERHWDRPAGTLRELIACLSDCYGPDFARAALTRSAAGEAALHPHIIFLINGRDARHVGGLDAPLQPDDVVAVFPMVAGG